MKLWFSTKLFACSQVHLAMYAHILDCQFGGSDVTGTLGGRGHCTGQPSTYTTKDYPVSNVSGAKVEKPLPKAICGLSDAWL